MDKIPPEFSAALKDAGLEKFFAGCTPAHRREYLKWIGEAKKTETKNARIAQAVKMISDKQNQEKRKRGGVRGKQTA